MDNKTSKPYKHLRERVKRFSIASVNLDNIYNNIRTTGVKDSLMWLLYILDDDKPHSQKSICKEWSMNKTTLNTAIKQAEQDGLLVMKHISGKRCEKNITLTNQGKVLAQKILTPIYEAENSAMKETLEKYSQSFIEAVEFFGSIMKEKLHNKNH